MDGWMDGRMDRWMDGRMDGWADGRADGWMGGCMGERRMDSGGGRHAGRVFVVLVEGVVVIVKSKGGMGVSRCREKIEEEEKKEKKTYLATKSRPTLFCTARALPIDFGMWVLLSLEVLERALEWHDWQGRRRRRWWCGWTAVTRWWWEEGRVDLAKKKKHNAPLVFTSPARR